MPSTTATVTVEVILDNQTGAGLATMQANLDESLSLWGMLGESLDGYIAKFALFNTSVQVFNDFKNALETTVNAAGDLQVGLTDVQIASSATDNQMGALQDAILSVATNSKFTANQVSDAFVSIADNGYSVADIIQNHMGQAAVNLAESTRSDLTPATKLLVTTMRDFGASASDAERYASALTYAFHHGIPDIGEMQTSLSQVAGTAANLKIPIEDLLSALDFLTRSGLSASQAGTSLRYILSSLTDPTAKATNELATLGIISVNTNGAFWKLYDAVSAVASSPPAFDGTVTSLSNLYTEAKKLGVLHTDEAFYQWAVRTGTLNDQLFTTQGTLKSLPDIIQIITTSMRGLNTDENMMAGLGQLFNVRSGQGASRFLNDKDIGNTLKKASADISQAEKGDLAKIDASKLMGDYLNVIQALQTTTQSFLAIAGMPFIQVLGSIAEQLNTFVGGLQKGNPEIVRFVQAFLLIGTLASGIAVLATAAILINPIALLITGGVVAAVLGLATAGGFLAAHWSQVQQVFNRIAPVIQTAIEVIRIIATTVAIFVGGSLPILLVVLGMLGVVVLTVVTPPLLTLGGILFTILAVFISVAASIAVAAGPFILIAGVIASVIAGFVLLSHNAQFLQFIFAALHAVLPPIVSAFQAVVADVRGQVMNAFQQLHPQIEKIVFLFNQARPALMVLAAAFGMIAVVLLGVVIGVVTGVIRLLGGLLSGIVVVISGIIQVFLGLVTFFLGFWTLLHGIFTGNGTLIVQGLSGMAHGILTIFLGLATVVMGVVQGLVSGVVGFFYGLVTGVIGFFQHLFNELVGHSIIPDMVTAILRWISGMGPQALSFILSFVSGFVGHMLSLASQVGTIAQNIVSTITGAIGGLASTLFNSGANMINMLVAGIKSAVGNVTSAVASVAQNIKNFLGFHSPTAEGPLSDADQYMPNMMSMYASGILQHKHLVTNAVGSVAASMHHDLNTPSVSRLQSSSQSYGQQTFVFQIDSKHLGTAVADRWTGELKQNGLLRAWR